MENDSLNSSFSPDNLSYDLGFKSVLGDTQLIPICGTPPKVEDLFRLKDRLEDSDFNPDILVPKPHGGVMPKLFDFGD